EGNYQALDRIYDAAKSLQSISGYSKEYSDYQEKLLDSYYIASEIKDEISKQINNLDYDEEELNSYIESLNEINKVKEKYKKNVDELIEYLAQITLDIEMAINYDEVLKESKEALIKAFNIVIEKSFNLTKYRKEQASKLEVIITNECKDLDLDNTIFEIHFDDINISNPFDKSIFNQNGIDKVNFLISFNKGEPLKPLYKVASGGEMSRMMLAFKSYLSKKSNVSLMVFDEIDTGVSGITAKKIANKMHSIASNIQVLCITHLPQVASIGDNHKRIYKLEANNRTYTRIDDLDLNARIEEIAMMLSGDKLSLYALEHAKALLTK
ncbi:MAG: hypothetical protein IJA65_05965, partial [Acholeplasmatales bacterium]|nr:hypothetical protein [Acholeplasmatales bacterium]